MRLLLRHGAVVLWIVAAAACQSTRPPADDSADAGFARDMATHHDQAVDMAFILRDVTADSRLRALTYDIIVTQTAQRGIFMGWLQQWGLSQSSDQPRMAWMSAHASAPHAHAAPDQGLMPGMASAEEMQALREARGRDAEVRFLQLMIRHHEGGVQMARAALAAARTDAVRQMARSIDDSQAAEIALMKELLAERAAQPLPSILG
jgi:uncharacterized protein (DUF305 family)